jgi:hypothetical protein
VSLEIALRVALAPLAVGLASLAARRWGHTVSGYLGGMPLIGGPITFFLAQDYGPAFAAQSASMTLAGVAGQTAYLLVFAHLARWRRGWALALAAGWISFALVSVAIATATPPLIAAIVLAAAGLAAAWIGLPRPREAGELPAVPAVELYLRLAAALVLAFAIVAGARVLGPVWSGLLLSLPVTGSIVPPFTLALYGPDAVARVTRGFVVGLTAFSAFFLVVAGCTVALGIAASFLLAVLAALAAVSVSSRLLKIRLVP